jgi:type I restriction enzyme S subunit
MTATAKLSGIAWVGDIPADWTTDEIRYMFTQVKEPNRRMVENNLLSLSHGSIIQRDIDAVMGVLPESFDGYNIIEDGDIVLRLTDMQDDQRSLRVGYSTQRGIITSAYLTLRLKTAKYEPKYYYYLLHDYDLQKVFYGMGAGVRQGLNYEELKRVNVLVPPLPEQQAIAAFLDDRCGQIDGIVSDLERQVDILRQYKKALITEMVTKGLDKTAPMKDSGIDWIGEMPRHWEMKRLKFLGTARNGLTYAPEDVVDEDKGTLVLRSSNIQNDRLIFDDNVYVSTRIPKEIILQENDLLICSRNGSQALIGKCALIDEKTAGQTYGAFMCVYRSRYNKFIHYVFLSDIFSYYLGTFLTSTVNQLTNLNLYNIQIPIPMDLNEQATIVDFLDRKCAEADDLIAEKQKAAEVMRQYKKSLIYEYVTGKKRVASGGAAE